MFQLLRALIAERWGAKLDGNALTMRAFAKRRSSVYNLFYNFLDRSIVGLNKRIESIRPLTENNKAANKQLGDFLYQSRRQTLQPNGTEIQMVEATSSIKSDQGS